MAICTSQKYVGRSVVLEYAIGCGDEVPTDAEFQRIGSLRTKEFSLSWETTDSTADDSIGSLRENLATFQSLTISGDGVSKASGVGSASLLELTKHVANPVATDGQPVAWVRMTFPDLTFTAYMIVTDISRSAPYDDVTTFSFEAMATGSDFGLIVEDTPDPDAPAVTGVQVVPGTVSLAVGGTYDLQAVVLPTSSDQRVTWSSSDPAEVSVNAQTGVIRALTVTATTALITATSKQDGIKSGDAVVTVA